MHIPRIFPGAGTAHGLKGLQGPGKRVAHEAPHLDQFVGGSTGGPLVLFDAAAPGQTALVLSPADNFLDSMIGFNRQYDVLQLGLQGKIATVPAGANTSFLLSLSGRGINAAMQKLGVTLRTLHNTTRPVRKTPRFIFKNDHFTKTGSGQT
eukprot:COSAG06_NODE_71_length_25945_cov_9.124468_16_plen_151_part_00